MVIITHPSVLPFLLISHLIRKCRSHHLQHNCVVVLGQQIVTLTWPFRFNLHSLASMTFSLAKNGVGQLFSAILVLIDFS